MDSFIENISDIIEKSANLFGVFALVALIFAFVAFFLFKDAEPKQKEKVFTITTLFLLGLVFFALIAGIAKEQDPLFVNNRTLGGQVVVDATAGFQNSGIYLKKDESVVLEPEGRIHLAADQIDNFSRLGKRFIAQNLEDRPEYAKDKKLLKLPPLDESNIFRRNWTGSDGEEIRSDFRLDRCKLYPGKWGMLLAVVMPAEDSTQPDPQVSAELDPFKVLESKNLKPSSLTPVRRGTKITARDYNGWLTFIINDAVVSNSDLASQVSRDYYVALNRAAEDPSLRGDDRHIISIDSIPLVWYADNVGSFRIIVKPE